MKVQMKVVMSGTRNGENWPLPGEELEVPDEEGANMCANELASPVRSDQDDVEKRDEEPAPKKPAASKKPGPKPKS
jgi:hypothetical protein